MAVCAALTVWLIVLMIILTGVVRPIKKVNKQLLLMITKEIDFISTEMEDNNKIANELKKEASVFVKL